MTKEAKPEGPVPLREPATLVEHARGKRGPRGRRAWMRIQADLANQVDQIGVHTTMLNGKTFSEQDILRMLLVLGIEAYRAKHPSFQSEVTSP